MADDTDTAEESDESPPVERLVERSFTCVDCGTRRRGRSPSCAGRCGGVRANCGEWTTGTAADEDLVDAARRIAAALAGDTLTERQALAYVLREPLAFDRADAARAMGVSPSSLDNLTRRAREKLRDAERTLGALEALRTAPGGT